MRFPSTGCTIGKHTAVKTTKNAIQNIARCALKNVLQASKQASKKDAQLISIARLYSSYCSACYMLVTLLHALHIITNLPILVSVLPDPVHEGDLMQNSYNYCQ